MAEFAEASSEPVVEVCAAKYCLHCFQKEYAIHYKMYVRRSMCEDEELFCLVT